MSTFSKSNFKTLNYNSFRPHYPPSFYKILINYIQKGSNQTSLPINKAIDLGCGTGVATYPLLNFVKNVIGLDLSPSMIETANSLKNRRLEELGIVNDNSGDNGNLKRIQFKVGSVEEFVNNQQSGIESNSIDLITAAQCIHWFQDYPLFFENSSKLLKKGGTLAYFYYIDPMIVDFQGPFKSSLNKEELIKQIYELYLKYAYNDPNLIGPYWEQPGRSILKNYCEKVNSYIPKNLYENIEINTFTTNIETKLPNDLKDLDMKKLKISIMDYIGYFETYSGFHNYKEKTGNENLLKKEFLKELLELTGWNLEFTTIDLVWNTGYTFLRKK
ncbi:uncharacterized protein KGF55_004473 [Candida pseudojiufengensis]|uniref:uncharacterized protein n=1 Tax=Candida pseudojiufengensis TaxID=497109 RepID=UPI002224C378|nr:uncharacterized protein KGF55_004473 [Candida pseudojiufengensis]KAI5960580.1 hypothetical protein KGF55_004473 [Candida pseudojiufengensis]